MQTAGRKELEDRVHLPQAPAGLEESSRLSRWESQQVPVLRNSKKLSHRGAGGITHASWNCLSELGCGHIPVRTGVNLEERGEKRDKGYYCFPAHLHSSKDQPCFQHLPWDHGSTWWHIQPMFCHRTCDISLWQYETRAFGTITRLDCGLAEPSARDKREEIRVYQSSTARKIELDSVVPHISAQLLTTQYGRGKASNLSNFITGAYTFILAAEPGTARIGCIFLRAWPWCWQNLCCTSESQTSERCCLLPSPLTLQMNTHSHAHHGDAQPLCSHARPAGCSDRAGGSAALLHPSSRSTISLPGENYRFFSKRTVSCFPDISWLLIQAASLLGKAFPTHHSST